MTATPMKRLLRSPAADAADRAAIAAEAARRRDEARRAHAAMRWGPPDDEPRREPMTRRDAWAALALVLLSALAAVWIGWALAAHVAERAQEAVEAMDRGAM